MSETSLIKIADQQLPLFGSDQMDPALFAAEESGVTPEFTGARLFANSIETYRAIVALSAEGLGIRRISRILRVSPNTILAVRNREPESIDADKKRLASLSREGARMCIEGIIEMMCDPDQVKKMSIKDKGIVFGILAEKSELLSGSPTARLQTIGAPAAVEVIEYMRWLKTEYDRRMGLGGGKEKQRAILPAAGADQAEAIEGELVAAEDRAPALPAPANAEKPTYQDKGRTEIVGPGAPGGMNLERIQAEMGGSGNIGLDADPEGSVGQTPHRKCDMPINIDPNEGAKNSSKIITTSARDENGASA